MDTKMFENFKRYLRIRKFCKYLIPPKHSEPLLIAPEVLRQIYLETSPQDRLIFDSEGFRERVATFLPITLEGYFKIDPRASIVNRKFEYVPPPPEFLNL